MADIEAEPMLIVPGHANELNAGFALFRPPHHTQINAHWSVAVEMHPELDALTRF
jgi:hypothetical protein